MRNKCNFLPCIFLSYPKCGFVFRWRRDSFCGLCVATLRGWINFASLSYVITKYCSGESHALNVTLSNRCGLTVSLNMKKKELHVTYIRPCVYAETQSPRGRIIFQRPTFRKTCFYIYNADNDRSVNGEWTANMRVMFVGLIGNANRCTKSYIDD